MNDTKKQVTDKQLKEIYDGVKMASSLLGVKLIIPQEVNVDELRSALGRFDSERLYRDSQKYFKDGMNGFVNFKNSISSIALENQPYYLAARVARSVLNEKGHKYVPLAFGERERMVGEITFFAKAIGLVKEDSECRESIGNITSLVKSKIKETFKYTKKRRVRYKDVVSNLESELKQTDIDMESVLGICTDDKVDGCIKRVKVA